MLLAHVYFGVGMSSVWMVECFQSACLRVHFGNKGGRQVVFNVIALISQTISVTVSTTTKSTYDDLVCSFISFFLHHCTNLMYQIPASQMVLFSPFFVLMLCPDKGFELQPEAHTGAAVECGQCTDQVNVSELFLIPQITLLRQPCFQGNLAKHNLLII